MKFGNFLKKVFISNFWVKAVTLMLAVLVVVFLNV